MQILIVFVQTFIEAVQDSVHRHNFRASCLSLMMECVSRFGDLGYSFNFQGLHELHEKKSKNPVAVGGFADVYRVEDPNFSPWIVVAVKKPRKAVQKKKIVSFFYYIPSIPNLFATHWHCRQSIFREILLWKQLHHSRILEVIGACTWSGTFPSIVTPWMQNGSINRFLQSSKIKIEYDVKLKWVSSGVPLKFDIKLMT